MKGLSVTTLVACWQGPLPASNCPRFRAGMLHASPTRNLHLDRSMDSGTWKTELSRHSSHGNSKSGEHSPLLFCFLWWRPLQSRHMTYCQILAAHWQLWWKLLKSRIQQPRQRSEPIQMWIHQRRIQYPEPLNDQKQRLNTPWHRALEIPKPPLKWMVGREVHTLRQLRNETEDIHPAHSRLQLNLLLS